MRTRLAWVVGMVALTGACGGEALTPAAAQLDGIALVSARPSGMPGSLSASRPPDCEWCTTAFGAEFSVVAPSTLTGVNLWLDGWSGEKRCLTSHQASPGDGFTLAGGQPTNVAFGLASVDCAPPFTVDRLAVRLRSGETLVYEGAWSVSLRFVD